MACDMNDGLIAAAMSSGAVILCTETGKMHTLKGHSLEAWTVSFDPHQPNILHSGGDDAKWRGWDLRSRDSTFTCSWHTAGVCSIQPHRTDANLIVTGSYDKYAALWDQRTLRQPVQTTKADSGVWKLKWHPSNDMRILAACMYDGFYVFDMEFARIHSKYDPQALSYGCAWLNDTTAVTCSFYNHQVQLWKVE
jgi:diphthamide biosynthesis protein 7